MLNKTDLAGAVSEGIISGEQARQLEQYARRVNVNANTMDAYDVEMRDEPFRLLRGFRDVFIALGVLFLAVGGTVGFFSLFFKDEWFKSSTLAKVSFGDLLAALGGIAVLTILAVLLAEIITRKLRLPLASLVLSITFAGWVGLFGMIAITIALGKALGLENLPADTPMIFLFLSAFAGITLFYIRYRLPFIVFVIASTIAGVLGSLILTFAPDFAEENLHVIIGVMGLAIFVAAMSFDIRDRLRVTRFSECGFWLHLLAAPMMIHAFFATSSFGDVSPMLVFSVFIVLTVFALMIDRRAILVSTLLYLSSAFFQIMRGLDLSDNLMFAFPIVALGITVVLLGVGWTPLRRLIVTPLPNSFKNTLPPVAASPIQHKEQIA